MAAERVHPMAITAVFVVLEEISQGHVTRSSVVTLAFGGGTAFPDPGPGIQKRARAAKAPKYQVILSFDAVPS